MRQMFDDIFLQHGRRLKVYVGKETQEDPFEKNVTISHNTVVPILAVVEDLTTTQAQWKMPGIKASKVKDVMIDGKHSSLITQSSKIEYNGEFYEGWREFGKMQMREELGINNRTYLRFYMYTKVT